MKGETGEIFLFFRKQKSVAVNGCNAFLRHVLYLSEKY